MARSERILTLAELEEYDPTSLDTGGQRRFCCPLPDCADKSVDSAHRSLSVETASGAWICHRCHNTGKLREFWEGEQSGGGRAKSRKRVLSDSLRLKQRTEISDIDLYLSYAEVDSIWQKSKHFGGSPGAYYLFQDRGITAQKALDAGVRYHDWFCYERAILFPFCTTSGELVAVNGRFIEDWMLPKSKSKGKIGLGVFQTVSDIWSREIIVVTEAPIDALSCAMADYPAIALSGVREPPTWLREALAWKTVILAFDSDDAGDKAAADWEASLPSVGATVLRYRPSLKDCNEVLLSGRKEKLRAELEAVYPLPAERTSVAIKVPMQPPRPNQNWDEQMTQMTLETVFEEVKRQERQEEAQRVSQSLVVEFSDWDEE